VQLFIDGLDSGEVGVEDLRRIALLDIVLNNADRKPEHLLIGDDGRVWAIDHGLTFHAHTKLRTVLWHFSGAPIPDEERECLCCLEECLYSRRDLRVKQFERLISATERQALLDRLKTVTSTGTFPNPRHKPVPYRW
jgi:uncharacterized repeat protein (TIGR03843 family)